MKTQRLIAAAIMLLFASCQKDAFNNTPAISESSLREMMSENGNNPDETILDAADRAYASDNGYVYIESNDADHNAILNYAQNHHDGSLTLEQTVMTGDKGAGAPLNSQGAVVLSKDHHWLFAVNTGSNSISSFAVDNEGDITLSHTRGCEGVFPVSICNYHDLVYVVNSVTADITGFRLESDGSLTYIPSSYQKLSVPNAIPAQIAFGTYGNAVIVTERFGNVISSFAIDASTGGSAAGIFTPSVGDEPFGFDFARDDYMIVSNTAFGAPHRGSCTSYEDFLHPTALNGAVPNGQTASCWVSVAKFGRYAFVTNTGNNTIASYYVRKNGNIYFTGGTVINTGLAPIDLKVSGDDRYVYCINSESHTIGKFKRNKYGGLTAIGTVPHIPDFAAGMAAY